MSSWPSATRMHRVQAAGFPSTHPTEATQPGSKFAKSKPKVHFPKRCVWAGAAPSVIGNPAASASPLLPRGLKMAQLGASDLCVSEVCLGTMTWGEQNTEAEACAQLNLAAECGVNFLDTAEIYPVAPRPETANRTSTYIGNWLRHRRRHEFVIATKVTGRSTGMDWVVANRTDPPGPPSNPRLDAPSIIAAAEGELRRLRTDYIDLLQLHWPDRYSLLHRTFEGDLAEVCAPYNLNLGLLPWSALAGGALTGKYLPYGTRPAGCRLTLFPDRYARFNTPRVAAAVAEYVRIAADVGLTPAQLGYAWWRSRSFIPSVLIGATTTQQLAENLAVFGTSKERLSDDVIAAIEEVHSDHRNPALYD